MSVVAAAVLLASCSDYPGTLWKPTIQYTVGGSISGLRGTGLVLLNNGGNNLAVGAGATGFTFSAALAGGGGHSVTVLSQPSNPTQTCTVTGGSGTVTNANVTSIQVACTTNSYTIGGTISGLAGAGLVLQDNNGNSLGVGAGSTGFTFGVAVSSGGSYSVLVLSQPSNPPQTCAVNNGSGVVASANIISVQIICAATLYTIGGTISGLTGAGLVLQDNGGNNLAVNAGSTGFAFSAGAASGAIYSVTVLSQPSSSSLVCGVSGGSGVVGSANVTSVQVTCNTIAGLFAYVTNQGNGSTGASVEGYSVGPTGNLVLLGGLTFNGGLEPFALAADGLGKHVYVTTINADAVFTFGVSSGTGVLTQVGPPTAVGSGPRAIAIHPSGSWLYVACPDPPAGIYGFRVDPTTGALKALPGSPFATLGSRPVGITLDPSGQFAFVPNNGSENVTVFSVNPLTGQLTAVGAPFQAGSAPSFAYADGSGKYLYVLDDHDDLIYAYAIASTGALTPLSVPTFQGVSNPLFSAVSPNGKFFYVPNWTSGGSVPQATVSAFSIDPSSGILSMVSGSPFGAGNGPASVAIDPTGRFAYVPNQFSGTISGFSLDSGTGGMSPLSTTPAGITPTEIAIVATTP